MSASKGDRVAVTVRMPTSLSERLHEAAAAEGTSLNDWAVARLAEVADDDGHAQGRRSSPRGARRG